ncbi:MAG: pirin family protein [Janthinobacterium lividum]
MISPAILEIYPLGFPWPTLDPFLFCVHHDDAYPAGNEQMGPVASLTGRSLGNDFSRQDGWSMYHGHTVPGFPAHPHRGFETVTIVRQGLIDHADSLGAKARFGGGDVQWLTAGRGIVHAEMFPLLEQQQDNPLELFQIWLNLPARSKMAAPYFKMLWAESIPRTHALDDQGRLTEVRYVCGRPSSGAVLGAFDQTVAPPPDSWASQPQADLAIWTIKMAPHAHWSLPGATTAECRRQLYFFKGGSISLDGQEIHEHAAIELRANTAVAITNGAEASEFLMLQARPIAETVAQYGPFVMNTEAEIRQALDDYQRTQFGGWPWPTKAPVHGSDPARLAQVVGHEKQTPPTALSFAAELPATTRW